MYREIVNFPNYFTCCYRESVRLVLLNLLIINQEKELQGNILLILISNTLLMTQRTEKNPEKYMELKYAKDFLHTSCSNKLELKKSLKTQPTTMPLF